MVDSKVYFKAILSQCLGPETRSCEMKCKHYCLKSYGALFYSHWSTCIRIYSKYAPYIHAYMRTYTHVYTCIRTRIHTYILIYIHTCIRAFVHTGTYVHTYIHSYIHTGMHTYTHVYTCIHTHIHTTYMHAWICLRERNLYKVQYKLLGLLQMLKTLPPWPNAVSVPAQHVGVKTLNFFIRNR
jgi:hypothetical protein